MTNEPHPSIPPASCMVVEQQQKLAANQQKQKNLEMMDNSGARNPIIPFIPYPINEHQMPNQQQEIFNAQQAKWQNDPKMLGMKVQQEMKRSNTGGMENMMNNMNQQQNVKNFQQIHKSPMQNDFSMQQQQQFMHPSGNFNSYHFPDANAPQFPGPVSLLPSDFSIQVPLPSPGQAMFPPNLVQNPPFTQSQQHHHSNDGSLIKAQNVEISGKEIHARNHNISSNIVGQNMHFNHPRNDIQFNTPLSECNNTVQDINIKKSPSKSTRSSPRNPNMTPTYVGGKTPQKSPSKSPRQPSTPASVESLSRQNSQKGKSTPNSNEGKQRKSRTNSQASPATTPSEHRGKGRPRNSNKNNKGRFPSNAMPFMPFNSDIDYIAIDKKLVGTVYDFDAEEFATNPTVENLRAMRDRRKSIELHGKMVRDGSSQSPKFSKSSTKPSTPLTHPLALNNNHALPNTVVNESVNLPVAPPLTSINLVNMPGPVDMRTYNSFDNTSDSYNSQLLGAFATNTVDQTIEDINEEQEKELQTALKASNDKQKTPTNTTPSSSLVTETKITTEISNIIEESVDSSEASFAKVSLSDSRNQLKLKIKGPLAHHHDSQSQSINNSQMAPQNTSASSAASSNRRPMRKKEWLQQYVNQGNTAESESSTIVSNDQHTSTNVSLNRVGGIPKAVDSLQLELLKDEFQDFNYAEYKKRKRFYRPGADPHEVNVDMAHAAKAETQNAINEVDPLAIETNNKKRRNQRGRGNQQPAIGASGISQPSKLKIKIGADIMETSGSDLPPKKRLIAQPPSYQDLKRDSMNFRKQMMDSFSEEKTYHNTEKSDKEKRKKIKKKKKDKKRHSVEIVSQPIGEGAPVKLILKFGSKPTSLNTSATSESGATAAPVEQQNKPAPPLKLKLSRNSQGNGEYNILNRSQQQHPPCNDSTGNNNNETPSVGLAENQVIETKTLEIALERIDDDIEKIKMELSNKLASNTDQKEDATKNCQVR